MTSKTNFKYLRTLDYSIPKTCALCMYGNFEDTQETGYCGKFQLDIFKYGGCPDGEIRYDVKTGEWGELVDRRKFARSTRHKAKVRY